MWEHIFGALKGVFGDRGLAVLALIGIAAVAIWVVYVFFSEGTRSSAQKYYDLKIQLCGDAAKAAAQIATSENGDVIKAAAFRFDELYWGELVLVEDTSLESAMVQFRHLIADTQTGELKIEELVTKKVDRTKLKSAALKISRVSFNLLQPNWLDQVKSFFRRPQKQ
jgi:hypothetical protein